MPQLDLSTFLSQFLWLGLFLALLYSLVLFAFLPFVRRSIDIRSKVISKHIAEAQLLANEGDGITQKIEEILAKTKLEAEHIKKHNRTKSAQYLQEELELSLKQQSAYLQSAISELNDFATSLDSEKEHTKKLIEKSVYTKLNTVGELC